MYLGAAVLVLVLAVVGSLRLFVFDSPSSKTLQGRLLLTDDATVSASCDGQGVDAAITPGADVSLVVESESQPRRTTLGPGQVINEKCVYEFRFRDVSPNAKTYNIKIAGIPGKLMTADQINASSWHADIAYGPPTTAVNGSLELNDIDSAISNCITDVGYDDITEGANVTVKDQDGRILGSGSLSAGTSYDGVSCTFNFVILDVRQDQQQYSVEVTHRGQITMSLREMQSANWTFAITLGG